MSQATIEPFEYYRRLAALRIEQAGFNSNDFSFDNFGDQDHPAIVIEYLPSRTRRIYALSNRTGETDKWAHHFIIEVKAGLFHDPTACAQQYANTQSELLRLQNEYSWMLWKSKDERLLTKWRDHREVNLRNFFLIVDEARNYGKGFLKAITILNAGAIVALLTFSHGVFSKNIFCPQVGIMLSDSVAFLIGLACSLFAMGIGYWSNIYYAYKHKRQKNKVIVGLFWFMGDFCGVCAYVAFFIGAYWARENIPSLIGCFS